MLPGAYARKALRVRSTRQLPPRVKPPPEPCSSPGCWARREGVGGEVCGSGGGAAEARASADREHPGPGAVHSGVSGGEGDSGARAVADRGWGGAGAAGGAGEEQVCDGELGRVRRVPRHDALRPLHRRHGPPHHLRGPSPPLLAPPFVPAGDLAD
eukprot:3937025-Rhodomonas_salina.3